MAYTREVHAVLSSVTATTTASATNIEGADQVIVVVKRANHSSGSTAMTATVSIDGTNEIAYDRFVDNVANDNSQTAETHIMTKTLSANGTDFVSMSPEDVGCWKTITVTLTEATDGTHSAWVVVYRRA